MELCWVEMKNLVAGTFSRLAAHRKCEEGRIQNEHGNEEKPLRGRRQQERRTYVIISSFIM
jgi:hypothetical protein